MAFCEAFETEEQAQEGYPVKTCDNCKFNEYDYSEGIAVCSKGSIKNEPKE